VAAIEVTANEAEKPCEEVKNEESKTETDEAREEAE